MALLNKKDEVLDKFEEHIHKLNLQIREITSKNPELKSTFYFKISRYLKDWGTSGYKRKDELETDECPLVFRKFSSRIWNWEYLYIFLFLGLLGRRITKFLERNKLAS